MTSLAGDLTEERYDELAVDYPTFPLVQGMHFREVEFKRRSISTSLKKLDRRNKLGTFHKKAQGELTTLELDVIPAVSEK